MRSSLPRLFLLALPLALNWTAGLAETDPPELPFRMALSSPPTTLDPVQTVDAATLMLHLNTHALLYRLRSSGELEPSLAETATREDGGRRWRIALRRGVHFCGTANGREVDAGDVAATLLRAARHPRSRVGWLFARAARDGDTPRIKVTSRHALSLEFLEPIDLPRYLALPQLGILPKEIAADANFAFGDRSHGSGPYRIASLQPDRVELEACPQGLPLARQPRVSARVIRDPQVALGALTAGQLDAMPLSFSQWRILKSPRAMPKGFWLLDVAETAEFEFLVLNTQNAKLRRRELREALNYALNRTALCGGPLLGYCVATDFTSAVAGAGANDDLYQPEKAQLLWRATPGKPRKLTLLSLPDERNITVASWVAEQWRAAFGIDTQVRTLEFGPLVGTLMGGQDFELATFWVQPLADIPEIWYLAWQPGDLPPKGRNVSRLDNPEFTAAFRELQAEGPTAENLSKVEEVLRNDPPAVPLLRRREAWLVSDRFDWIMGRVLAPELWTLAPARRR